MVYIWNPNYSAPQGTPNSFIGFKFNRENIDVDLLLRFLVHLPNHLHCYQRPIYNMSIYVLKDPKRICRPKQPPAGPKPGDCLPTHILVSSSFARSDSYLRIPPIFDYCRAQKHLTSLTQIIRNTTLSAGKFQPKPL